MRNVEPDSTSVMDDAPVVGLGSAEMEQAIVTRTAFKLPSIRAYNGLTFPFGTMWGSPFNPENEAYADIMRATIAHELCSLSPMMTDLTRTSMLMNHVSYLVVSYATPIGWVTVGSEHDSAWGVIHRTSMDPHKKWVSLEHMNILQSVLERRHEL